MRKQWLIRLVITVSVLLAAITVASPEPPVRAAGKMEIVNSSTESNFRENFIFRATATSAESKIVSASLLIRQRGSGNSGRSRHERFEPANEVKLEYVLETRTLTTPPWQVLTYQWEIVNEAGEKFTSEPIETEYADNTRAWQRKEGKGVTFFWYDQPESFADGMLLAAETGFEYVSKATGFTPAYNIRVVLYNSQAEYCSYWAVFECKDWYGATTHQTVTVQYLIPNQLNYVVNEVIPHELAHAFLHARLEDRVFAIPNWFNEGQAVNNELASVAAYVQRTRDIARLGQLERLEFMESRTTITYDEASRVSDWYATATSLVTFLYERFEPSILGKIVDRVAEGKTFEEAFTEATNWTLVEYEIEWRKWLGLSELPPTLIPTETLPAFFPTPTFAPTKTPNP
jgi:hypothetical protein